jgi:hypothetical protein
MPNNSILPSDLIPKKDQTAKLPQLHLHIMYGKDYLPDGRRRINMIGNHKTHDYFFAEDTGSEDYAELAKSATIKLEKYRCYGIKQFLEEGKGKANVKLLKLYFIDDPQFSILEHPYDT